MKSALSTYLLIMTLMLGCSKQDFSPISGTEVEQLKPFDDMMKSFMKKYDIPGGTLAVTKDSRLIYARGFGYADLEAKTKVLPTALFRIASLAKPITGVAIMQLIEKGLLNENDKMVDALNLKNHLSKNAQVNPDWQKIKIGQLLTHTAGWDRDKDIDPMFYSPAIVQALKIEPAAEPWDIIRFMAPRFLQFEPGLKYVYSNFGYTLLGRIIEQKTGQSYEEYVRKNVFEPLGITSSKIGKTIKKLQAEGEVSYYFSEEKFDGVVPPFVGKAVTSPYGCWYLEAMDAHGGWVSSVIELARFLCAFDDFDKCSILTRSSIQRMFFPKNPGKTDEENVYYTYGWWVRKLGTSKHNAWHTGLLPGTSTLMLRRYDNMNWVILFNAGKPHVKDGSYGGVIDPPVHKAAAKVRQWPTHDLFPEYFH